MMKCLMLLVIPLLLVSCGTGMDPSERAAQDRIMLVRKAPPTLGYRRLAYQTVAHPDLGRFLTRRGQPDFIAETSTEDRQYLILYYLEKERAFACRSWRNQPDAIEFAGPYPITKKETDVLRSLRDTSADSAESGIAAGRVLIPQRESLD